ncbi:pro-neuregulin-4, membrane-bound isoform [Lissotriton helveticus]
MPTDHGEPCGDRHLSFCLNGGFCYLIPSVSRPYCRCSDSFTGARCQETFLPSKKAQPKTATLTNVLVLAVVIGVLFTAVLYFICRIRRKLKMKQNAQDFDFHGINCERESP